GDVNTVTGGIVSGRSLAKQRPPRTSRAPVTWRTYTPAVRRRRTPPPEENRMVDHSVTADGALPLPPAVRPKLDASLGPRAALGFFGVLALALFFVAYSIDRDVHESGTQTTAILPFVLLGVALLVALGFEFVNGFHDTANAVATVIYTHSLPAQLAVVWSGTFNFLGVMASSGAVAYGIIALLPVELILQVGSASGFAMVFALLIGAIV